ncbi:MAG: hypothetical protein AMXMBFR13_44860 [Phycisphaerae bacterium]
MSDIPLRHRSIHRNATIATWAAGAAGLVLVGAGIYVMAAIRPGEGALVLSAGVMLICFAVILQAGVLLLMKAEANINRINNTALDIFDLLRQLDPHVRTIADNSLISDAAKSITHRERESEALRQAIREEMYSGDWEAAHYLIDEMERRFGYKLEAQKLRDEMIHVREMTIEEKIGQAIAHIERLLNEHSWDRARQESERLMRLFPRHEQVLRLPAELSRRRQMHKQELLTRWKAAVARSEIDEGIAILTQLDQYLTPTEAQELRDSARDVFKARLLNLGVQFGLAVSEARWRNALEVGLQIRQEFPNSRMAQEVADKLETLRVRAGFVADADMIEARSSAPTAPPATR